MEITVFLNVIHKYLHLKAQQLFLCDIDMYSIKFNHIKRKLLTFEGFLDLKFYKILSTSSKLAI